MLVHELMSKPAITIAPEASLKEAMEVMDEHVITSMPVIDAEGRLVGVISEANLIADVVLPDERKHMIPVQMEGELRPRRVADVMATQLLTVDAEDDVTEAVGLMSTSMVKSLPVLSSGAVVGMLSRRDIIHVLARHDDDLRESLDRLAHAAGYHWQIDVDGGVVSISGPNDDAEARLARGLAGSVAGVVAVHVDHPAAAPGRHSGVGH